MFFIGSLQPFHSEHLNLRPVRNVTITGGNPSAKASYLPTSLCLLPSPLFRGEGLGVRGFAIRLDRICPQRVHFLFSLAWHFIDSGEKPPKPHREWFFTLMARRML